MVFWKLLCRMMLIMLVMVLELQIVEVLFLSIFMCLMVLSGMVLRLVKIFWLLLVRLQVVMWWLFNSISVELVFRLCSEMLVLLLVKLLLKVLGMEFVLLVVRVCRYLVIVVLLVWLIFWWVIICIGDGVLVLVCGMFELVIVMWLRLVVCFCVKVEEEVMVLISSRVLLVRIWVMDDVRVVWWWLVGCWIGCFIVFFLIGKLQC